MSIVNLLKRMYSGYELILFIRIWNKKNINYFMYILVKNKTDPGLLQFLFKLLEICVRGARTQRTFQMP